MIQIENLKEIYFIGIGGIGMSALARYFHNKGVSVSGYDRVSTHLTRTLEKEGMLIHYSENADQIPGNPGLVIYTPAIPAHNIELKACRERGYIVKKRAEVLGLISKSRKTIAVAGTHGKTTTSSILTFLLCEGGFGCSAFLGGIMVNYQTNYLDQDGGYAIMEADEYDRSFFHLVPEIAVVTSLDADHLDIYGTFDEMKGGFVDFLRNVTTGGLILVHESLRDIITQNALERNDVQIETYGIELGDHQASSVEVRNGIFHFDLQGPDGQIEDLSIQMAGRHNVLNATAACVIALKLGLSPENVKRHLRLFKGIKRRFEFINSDERRVFIDDYAHHPEELRAAINAARELYPSGKLTVVFQPHLYSRTRDFADGFADVLATADELILLEIYPAREEPLPGVDSSMLFNLVEMDSKILTTKKDLLNVLRLKETEVLMTLGAGDIDGLIPGINEIIFN
jgi:UDP-N-acetylmuramate--alanine ligase